MSRNPPTQSAAAVIGLGLMGRSIATCLLSSGWTVVGVTENLETSLMAPQRIRQLLDGMFTAGFLSQPVDALMGRFHMTQELTDAARVVIVF